MLLAFSLSLSLSPLLALSGTRIKDTWTKPKGGRIKGGKWGWLEWGAVGGMETTVLEQQ